MFPRDGAPEEPRAEIIEVIADPRALSDEQLSAALAAQSERTAGRDSEVAGGRPVGPIGRRSSRAVIATAGLVVTLGVVVLAGLANLSRPRPLESPGPTVAAATTGPPATFPTTAAGLPVFGVGTAISMAADGSISTGEIAVGGWYTAVRLVESCALSLQPPGTCLSDWSSVLESQPDIVWGNSPTSHPAQPGTNSITARFIDPIDLPKLESQDPGGPLEVVSPSPVVLIGHFQDDRVPDGSTFVVDAVADQTGTIAALAGSITVASTQLTTQSVAELIRSHLQPAGFVLGFGAVPWSTDASAAPVVEPSADGPPADGRTVWLVRGFLGSPTNSNGRAVASWMGIDDVTGQTWGPLATPQIPAPPGPGFPTAIEGLTVHSVGQARAAARGVGGLVAIAGYLSNDRAPEGCPLAATTGKPNPCSDTGLAMIDEPGSILQPNDATFLYDLAIPAGRPSIRPLILPGTSAPDPWAGQSGLVARVEPQAVVLIGQFGDPRSPECAARPGGGSAGCDLSFVVDEVAWINGMAQGPSVWVGPGVTPAHSSEQVAALAHEWPRVGSAARIVSMTATSAADSVALTGARVLGRKGLGLVWIVRVVGDPSSATPGSGYLVIDDATLALIGQVWLAFANP